MMKTHKRRLGAILAAVCLMLSIFPTTAFAVTGSSGTQYAQTSVEYTAKSSYVIDIPSSISFVGDETGQINVSCSHNTLASSKTINVSVDTNSTLESDGNFYLRSTKDGTTRLKCDLLVDGIGPVSTTNCVIMSCAGGETGGTGLLHAQVSAVPPIAGTYTGTIYFKITVE